MPVEALCLQTDKICYLANTVFLVTILTWKLKIEGLLSESKLQPVKRDPWGSQVNCSLLVKLQLSSIIWPYLQHKAMFYTLTLSETAKIFFPNFFQLII